ncbi:MAG: hypothetical protein RLN63_08595, partial [Miltoncostaeaceae bacterium]
GNYLPAPAPERPPPATVVAVGEGRGVDGARQPLEVSVGDEVIYSKYGGTEITEEGEDIMVLAEHDILAIVASEPAKKGKKKK